jgi:hypothetical protein
LLDVPQSLIPKKHGRTLRMVTLTPTDKIKAKLMMAQAKADKQAAIHEKLKKDLAIAE